MTSVNDSFFIETFLSPFTRNNEIIGKLLREYIESGNTEVLECCTFKHIVNYLEEEDFDGRRLKVALEDFGIRHEKIRPGIHKGAEIAQAWLDLK